MHVCTLDKSSLSIGRVKIHFILYCRFDRTLGGLEVQLRLRDHLAKLFNEQKKTKNDVFKNPRSMGKLFKEAGRVKQVLSANSEHFAQVRNRSIQLVYISNRF